MRPRERKLATIVKLFAKAMFHGNWVWETPNERVIEMLMRDIGMYPFEDENDMISKTRVSEGLYLKAKEVIPTRKPIARQGLVNPRTSKISI
ncbi:MAG: hypothetical protein HOG49_30375 [Candidatus Scalindua sp.]|jgi:hypothetical protein|nr:hypothetical protein [Candidatus Scalindua sp.]